uniref:Malectin domain-containing protein n=1 Tax=Angiostrongylus cantonensis TaxID=6313 RepID=A0A158P6H2_ANGCA
MVLRTTLCEKILYENSNVLRVFSVKMAHLTERYDFGDLVYRFTIEYDGSYVVILKFSEVYFESPGLKVFDVYLNNILVKDKLDIFFETNAAGLAFDMYVDFSIKDKQLKIGDVTGYIDRELQIRLTPVVDNPKINAIAVLSGTSETLPPPPGLPPPQSRRRPLHPSDVDYDDLIYDTDYDHQIYSDRSSEHEFASGPPTPNPFEGTTDNIFLYLGVALVCLLPVVAILVRM